MQVTKSIQQVVALIALLENQFYNNNRINGMSVRVLAGVGAVFWIGTENSVDNTGMF